MILVGPVAAEHAIAVVETSAADAPLWRLHAGRRDRRRPRTDRPGLDGPLAAIGFHHRRIPAPPACVSHTSKRGSGFHHRRIPAPPAEPRRDLRALPDTIREECWHPACNRRHVTSIRQPRPRGMPCLSPTPRGGPITATSRGQDRAPGPRRTPDEERIMTTSHGVHRSPRPTPRKDEASRSVSMKRLRVGTSPLASVDWPSETASIASGSVVANTVLASECCCTTITPD